MMGRVAKGSVALVFLAAAACGSEGTAGTATPQSSVSEAISSPSVADRPLTGGLTLKPTGSMEGAPLGYAEYLPPGYGDGGSRPLLVFLHGSEEYGDGSDAALDAMFKLGIPKIIRDHDWPKDRPFVVLMPQYALEDAGHCQLAEEVDSFLAFALEHYDVDEERVYLTGVGCGAIAAWDYLATYGEEVVSAAVVISGHAQDALQEAGCALGHVPVWVFHGADDSVVPIDFVRDQIATLRACDPPPDDLELTVYPGIDRAWTPTYSLTGGHDIYAWLLAHEGR